MIGQVLGTFKYAYLKHLVILFGCLFLLHKTVEARQVNVAELKCDYLENPNSVGHQKPTFSWSLISDKRGIYQKSYRIVVDELPDNVKKEKGEQWDSGWVVSDRSNHIDYKGKTFESNTSYYWRVGIKTDQGEEYWSESTYFHTALLNEEDWKAKWITSPEIIEDGSPIFRKSINLDKKIKQAYLYITACGFYEFYINGAKVGDQVLDPAVTDYRKRVIYSAFDVSHDLEKGENVLGVMIGNGAYNMRKTLDRYSWGSGGETMGNPIFIMQLHLEYEDGSEQTIVSDESWHVARGPITFNNIYGGEDYDARRELSGWSSNDSKEVDWLKAKESSGPGGKLVALAFPPIKVTETLQPIKKTHPKEGVYLFDLGQNIAGWWRITMKGHAGQTIRVRGSETLNDDLFPKDLENGDYMSEKFAYHAKTWTDYTMKGDEEEEYEPRFFYSGFRYIEVATDDSLDLKKIAIQGRVVRSALERSGNFVCSDTLLNKIYQAGIWSQKGNTVGYPTDCPHREKGAYNGDGQVIAETSMHDFNMAPFYYKWLDDMRDAQEENGRIPNTSPTLIGGMGGGVAWGSAYILIPYWMNHYYGDVRVLEKHYPSMKRYMQYLENLAKTDKVPEEEYIINDFMSYWYALGEWCSPGMKDGPNHSVVNTFYFFYNARLMSSIARELGEENDALYFEALSDSIKKAFNQKFFNPDSYLYGTDSTYQTYQLLALVGDLVPEANREGVFKTIVDDLNMRNKHLNTGIIGTKYLWPILEEGNKSNLAYEVAKQRTYPSFGYWLDNYSTTLLEKFDGSHSHNHQMFGSIVEYFYKYLAGIKSPLEGRTTKGYREMYLAPSVPDGLSFVNASLKTVSGRIVSHWVKTDQSFKYLVEIPANTRGTVSIPLTSTNDQNLLEGKSVIWKDGKFIDGVQGIRNVHQEGDDLVIEIFSGRYNFELVF
ncbi:family 78 glycoside hydrolase catalytic domain [Echinicola sp. 20G]|uniref:family 78 glycoside hydrolase catalytic domain n=1 Tax=Echinicola sp. 20G TaxID=2781961 RepID=UPI00190FF798|nr:family 78 glycoside hydrolase catalytic domain [Echinicola sp. 20G]